MEVIQIGNYLDDAEELERVVYTWAGLEKPDEEYMEINGLDLNAVAKTSYGDAERRGKIDKYTSSLMQINKIKEEWGELFRASNNASIHIPYTEQQEEAADVIIATLMAASWIRHILMLKKSGSGKSASVSKS